MKRSLISLILLFLLASFLPADKDPYPKNYFRSPIDFPIRLSGSFGEVRKNHIHSGIDIRTEGVEGKPVYAVADGYVARIFVSPVGFGRALYIVHPNGFMSVYGHVRNFNAAIGNYIRNIQYQKESFAEDVQVEPGVLKVKKGEVIANSGNAGSSGGPHLHFEMRDAATQEIINPLLFGYNIADYNPPRINAIRIYPKDENSLVNHGSNPLNLPVTGSDGKYSLKEKDTIAVSGNIYFGIETLDYLEEGGGKAGVSSIELFVDTARYFSESLNRFAFAETRYVNSILDYPFLVTKKKIVQRSYIAPGNKIRIFGKCKSNGVVNFTGKQPHKVIYVVKDFKGNTARLEFWVRSHPQVPAGHPVIRLPRGTMFHWNDENDFKKEDIVFHLPKDALYEDLDFEYEVSPAPAGAVAKMHHLHNDQVPVHVACTLSIRPDRLPPRLAAKAVIVNCDSPGRYFSVGGKFENGFIKTTVKEFGDYTVLVDTVPPGIYPVNVANNKNIGRQGTIKVKISDNLSGIDSYRGTLNGKWILMDYDAKSHMLTYAFDDRLKKGKNDFKLVVRDVSGNETVWRAVLVR
jgi:murein DD-endopeptidase MepM/ murein hydrolase activator NlpD